MFHKRLMKEFKENQKYVAGMVAVQWGSLLCNVVLMYAIGVFLEKLLLGNRTVRETFLFEDTIENNIKVAKENATREEVVAAAKKAALHEFILSLPDGYDTKLAELGDSVSGGERQRIGIARAFLHDGDMIFLDEPTSNIDSLNEGIILRSLDREKENKTILLVSHRKSTMAIADDVVTM